MCSRTNLFCYLCKYCDAISVLGEAREELKNRSVIKPSTQKSPSSLSRLRPPQSLCSQVRFPARFSRQLIQAEGLHAAGLERRAGGHKTLGQCFELWAEKGRSKHTLTVFFCGPFEGECCRYSCYSVVLAYIVRSKATAAVSKLLRQLKCTLQQ